MFRSFSDCEVIRLVEEGGEGGRGASMRTGFGSRSANRRFGMVGRWSLTRIVSIGYLKGLRLAS